MKLEAMKDVQQEDPTNTFMVHMFQHELVKVFVWRPLRDDDLHLLIFYSNLINRVGTPVTFVSKLLSVVEDTLSNMDKRSTTSRQKSSSIARRGRCQ